jgi:hypothetical protein
MKKTILTTALFSLTLLAANAQDKSSDNHNVKFSIPEIALLDIESGNKSNDITLTVEAPTEAGESVVLDNAYDKSLWLNYTSIVNKNKSSKDNNRNVAVKISNGTVPGGLNLNVQAQKASSDGKGDKGSPVGTTLTLSSNDQDIITGIGSCYTGNGDGKGHQLVYSLELAKDGDAFGELDNDLDNTEITITYTISDN